MKDPRLSNISSNMTISNEVILSSQLGSDEDPFAEYMWMENEEEFNRQVEEELWEEEFIERCFQEMLEEEEQWEWFIPSRDLPQLQDQISLLVLDADEDFDVVVSSRSASPPPSGAVVSELPTICHDDGDRKIGSS
ncbi:polyadenylate-binding protein-interacting protein 2-like isoform X1 [Sebastes umbrosus]|uniref:polyadenylate-binding protein-interacting protein 2-like isoform X1 n=1 Tax=Sebastes umbrosus TaxID=72105 RepID=UPI00189CA344|nr:polyadenylate-binding protein-interacting protein 2-like isoform X1 [Sebastes umbrosus]XP_037635600.1 polyadenylate-binding protein-interacting protein 2-like isoform X1 [Sebastes umbrosus]XP_037635601.1 polyadenylate-binding protein-interacting protein 2-like isoform X1 [Sebastes umbrosus]